MQRRHAPAYNNAAEHAGLQCQDAAGGRNGSLQHIRRDLTVLQNVPVQHQHRIDRRIHDEISNRGGERGNLLFPLCHADCHADCKNKRKVIEHRAAYLIHDHQQCVQHGSFTQEPLQPVGGDGRLVRKGTADAKKQPCHRQNRDRQHKAAPDAL